MKCDDLHIDVPMHKNKGSVIETHYIVATLAELAASGAGWHSTLPIFCSASYMNGGKREL